MDRKTVALWAGGMAEIFRTAKPENVQHEIQMLLESLHIEQEREYWQDVF
jgi:hypothetical protein